jgi:hypothetical protein
MLISAGGGDDDAFLAEEDDEIYRAEVNMSINPPLRNRKKPVRGMCSLWRQRRSRAYLLLSSNGYRAGAPHEETEPQPLHLEPPAPLPPPPPSETPLAAWIDQTISACRKLDVGATTTGTT